ncbi:MAG: ATP-binding protein [Candidatus Woesearchaeota archaeon]
MEVLLKEWQELWTPELKERHLPEINFKSRKIVVFTGVRRCGKTYTMFQLINSLALTVKKDCLFYINFEDERIEKKTELLTNLIPSLMKLYGNGSKRYFLFLDEIQVIPDWSRWLRRVFDSYRNITFFVSGSSSKLSSKEIPTELRGRAVSFDVLPLSFKEFLTFKGLALEENFELSERKLSHVKSLLLEYLDQGGFPEVVSEELLGNKHRIVQDYFRTIINRDIAERHHIKNTGLLSDFLRLLVNSTRFSINKTVNVLRSQGKTAGKETIINYARYAEESYFCYFVPIFSYKIKDQEQYPKKVYLSDNSFISDISLKFSKDSGKLYENMAFIELKRRQAENQLIEIFYWADKESEVDFVVKERGKAKELVQVCYNIGDYDVKARETRALIKASKELKCKRLLVITEDYEGEEEAEWRGARGRIKYIPMWKWLLE